MSRETMIKKLKDDLAHGRVVTIVGTGVSVAACGNQEVGGFRVATWTGLLRHGVQHCVDLGVADEKVVKALIANIESGATDLMIGVAETITGRLKRRNQGTFRGWLQDTIGKLEIKECAVLDAVVALPGVLATLNYDNLLEDAASREAVTWLKTQDVQDVLRDVNPNAVLHLHGWYREPESVVFGLKSYLEVKDHPHAKAVLNLFTIVRTLLFVGCGDTVLDPNFVRLIEWAKDAHADVPPRHYLLCRTSEVAGFQKKLADAPWLQPLDYGAAYEDLAPFLRSLVPGPVPPTPPVPPAATEFPKPPAFHAEPDYIGSHAFVGRDEELRLLSDWAQPGDPANLLLYEAIGGNGKSMLTWEWATKHAQNVRAGKEAWAGRFWYSFYERGAIMADFCQRALAYMKGQPLEEFAKKKTAELKDELLRQLHAAPWLLILDGLERVLVAYHRIDAAEVGDEQANDPTDKIGHRNPCDAIREEDNSLLRALAAAMPSKILVSSRLTPRVLLNPAGQPITGVKRVILSGLDSSDAEKLLCSCGVEGESAAIRRYLEENCDNHPLVVGILGGLIAHYLPARGDFDVWSAAKDGGAALNLANLNLTDRRNHILRTAFEALPPASRQLLSVLALFTDSIDYETLQAFNPHLPPEPKKVKKPELPEDFAGWKVIKDFGKTGRQRQYEAEMARWQEYEAAVQTWRASPEFRDAPMNLGTTVTGLEDSGLLQWDAHERKYNLHPVVRGVVWGAMKARDRERDGGRVLDYFSTQHHPPYEEAETIDDVRVGLQIVSTQLRLGRFRDAARTFRGGLTNALLFNVEAYAEFLSTLRPIFRDGWDKTPDNVVGDRDAAYLATGAGIALGRFDEQEEALGAHVAAILSSVKSEDWISTVVRLSNAHSTLKRQNLISRAFNVAMMAHELAAVTGKPEDLFGSQLDVFSMQSLMGRFEEAEKTWEQTDRLGRKWHRAVYRPGTAESSYAHFMFQKGSLTEAHLSAAEELSEGVNRREIRKLRRLRGDWRLEQGDWEAAAASYGEALRLARERGLLDVDSETGLALAKYHLNHPDTPRHPNELAEAQAEARRLAELRRARHRRIAQFWQALGDFEEAKRHALAAYRWAWADGEPYVRRYELAKTTELLRELGVGIPQLPPYDPARDKPLPWESKVGAAIERRRLQK